MEEKHHWDGNKIGIIILIMMFCQMIVLWENSLQDIDIVREIFESVSQEISKANKSACDGVQIILSKCYILHLTGYFATSS